MLKVTKKIVSVNPLTLEGTKISNNVIKNNANVKYFEHLRNRAKKFSTPIVNFKNSFIITKDNLQITFILK